MKGKDHLHLTFMEGEELFYKGDEEGALAKWKECLKIKPGWKMAISGIVAILKEKSYEDLISFIDSTVEACDEDYKNFLLTEKASALFKRKNYSECETLCRELLDAGYNTSFVLKLYIQSLSAQEKWDKISEYFEGNKEEIFEGLLGDLAIFHIKNPEVAKEISLEGKGGFLLERWLSKWRDELTEFVKARTEEPFFKEMPFLVEKTIVEIEKDYEKGKEELLKCIELFPESSELLSIAKEVGKIYQDRELVKRALYRLKEVINPPQNAFVIEELINFCEEDESEEALSLMEELYSIHKMRDVFERMLVLAIKIGDYKKAGDLLKSISESLAHEERVLTLLDSALWYDKAGDFESEKKVLYYALELEPSNSVVLDRLESVLFRIEDWDGLIEVYKKKISTSYDPKDLLLYSMKIGEVYENYKGDLESAAKAYEDVLEISPGYLPAIEALKRVEKRRENWGKVIAVNERLADLSSDVMRIASLFWENGLFYLIHLDDIENAVKSFEKVLSVTPENKEVMRILRSLLLKTGNYESAFEYLKKEIEITSPEETDHLFFEGAVIFLIHKDSDKVLNILERFLDKEGYKERIFYYLYSICSQLGRWNELVEILMKISEGSEGPFQNFLNFLIGKIMIEKLNKEGGKEFIKNAIKGGVGNWWSFLKMEELLIKEANLEELMELYKSMSEKIPLLKEVYSEVLSLLGYHINNEDISNINLPTKLWFGEYLLHSIKVKRDFWEQLRKSNFPHEWIIEIAVSVIDQLNSEDRVNLLKECIDVAQSFAELSTLEREVLKTRNDDLYVLLLSRKKELGFAEPSEYLIASRIEERRKNIEGALRWIDEYIVSHVDEIYPLSMKTSILKEAERWEDAVETMKRWAELEESDKRRELLEECGEICMSRLDAPQKALEIYEALNSSFPQEEKYLERVLSACELIGDYKSYIKCVSTTISAMDSAERRADLCLKVGQVLENKAGLEDNAVEFYWTSFNFLKRLSSLNELERIFRNKGDSSTLVGILEEKVNLVDDVDKGAIYGEAGHIYYRNLNRVEKAEERFSKALEYTFPEDYSIDLIEVRLTLKDKEKLKEAVDKVLKNVRSSESIPLLLDVSQFFLSENEPEYVEKVLNQVLDIEGDNEDALSILVELYRKEKMWTNFVNTGEKLGRVLKEKDRDRAGFLYNELGVVARDEMADYETSVSMFKKALEMQKDFIEARKNLADILIELKRDKEAYQECKKVLLNEPLRVNTLHFMAYYYESNKMPDKAFCTVEILNLIGEMDNKMEKVIWEVSSNKRKLPQSSFSPSYRERIAHHKENKALNELFSIIGDYIFGLYGLSASNLGMSKDALVSQKVSHPIKKVLEEIVRFFGIRDFSLYISESFKSDVIVPSIHPLSVVVGSKLGTSLKEDALRYVITKKVEMALKGYMAVDLLDDEKVCKGIIGFLALTGMGYEFPADMDSKTVSKAIPWLQRGSVTKRIGEIAKKLGRRLTDKDVDEHLKAVRKSAGRVALFVSRGLKNAVEGEIYTSLGKKSEIDLPKIALRNEYLFDIFRFYSTDVFFSLREKLGVSVA